MYEKIRSAMRGTGDFKYPLFTYPASETHPDHIIMPIFPPFRMMHLSGSYGDGQHVISSLRRFVRYAQSAEQEQGLANISKRSRPSSSH